MKKRALPGLLIALTLLCYSLTAQKSLVLKAESVQTAEKNGVLEQLDQYELFSLDARAMLDFARKTRGQNFEIQVQFGKRYDWTMVLQASKIHGDDFRFVLSTGVEVEVEKNITYKGYLKNDPSTKVRVTISDHYIFGLILDDDQHVFESVNRLPRRTDRDVVAVYKSKGLGAGQMACGHQLQEEINMPGAAPKLPDSHPAGPAVRAVGAESADGLLTATYCPKLGITLDWQGLGIAGTVGDFNAYLQSIMNIVNNYYSAFNVEYELNPVYVIYTAPNPWTDVSGAGNEDVLTQNFANWAFPNLTPNNYNCALLFTGLNMGGYSYAFFKHMCPGDNYRYGEIDYHYVQPITQRANLTTHELGHLWDARHTGTSSSYIMSPSVYDGTLQWDPTSSGVISSSIAELSSCLPSCSNVAVALNSPSSGQTFANLNPVSMAASAAANSGSITQVEFFAGNVSVGVDLTSPYTASWTPPAYGSYTLKAVATDNSGTTATSQININVQATGSCGTVTGLSSASVATTSATVSWSAVNGTNNYTVDYKVSTASTWTTAASATTATSVTINGLTASTLYDWRVRANCTGAAGAYMQAQFTTSASASTLFTYGAPWKYLDNGSNQGAAWSASGFNDAGWASGNGQLGYGDNDEATVVSYGSSSSNKYITTYFRKTIGIANPSAYGSFTGKVKRDDGIIVYVNGTEVYRNNLTTGAVTYTTTASLASDDGATAQTFAIPVSAFVAGNNVIAVEIHQESASSSDISFDMELQGALIAATCGSVTGLASAAITGSDATLSWTAVSGAATYTVDYKPYASSTWLNAISATTATSVNLGGLAASTLYDWRVKVNCAGATGAYASAQFTTAGAGGCGTVSGLTSSAITNAGATLNWSALSGANNYDVAYKTNTASTWTTVATATAATSVALNSLTATTLYDWRVRANCTGATGAYASAQFTTAAAATCGTVSGLAASAVTNAGATLSWSALSGANSYDVEYKTNAASTWTTVATATAATSAALSGLTANTLYDWRVRANCTGATGAYAGAQFTTAAAATCGTVSGLAASAITNAGVTLSWSALSGANSYDVEYKTNAASTWTTAATATTSTSAVLNGLTASTLYDWQVRANCAGATGAYVSAQFTTAAAATCGTVSGLAATAITTSGATLSWSALSGANNYDVEYKTNAASTWTTAATATTATLSVLTGLSASTFYDWRVRANCTGATGAYTSAQFTTAAAATCGTVGGLASSAITASSATLSWTALSGANTYDVEVKVGSASVWTAAATATAATSLNLGGLSGGILYDWRVRANCTGATGAYAGAQFITTASGDCGMAPGLNSASITASGAVLSWSALSGANTYDVDYKAGFGASWTNAATATTATSVTLSGLTASTLYDWRVRANCVTTSGSYAAAQFSTISNNLAPDFNYGASWKYLDNGTNQGTAWRGVSFNDAAWASGNGELGYGDYDETTVVGYGPSSSNRYVTTYFRKIINMGDPTAFGSFTAYVKRDDGIAVYVNGAEVYRNNLGSGTFTYTTLASLASDDGTTPLSFSIAPAAFNAGTNAIAVEIHQTEVNSSDITFDMKLVSTPASGTCGTLSGLAVASITTAAATLSWPALPGALNYTVEYKTNAASTWTSAAAATTATTVNLSGLAASTLYDWRVRANCSGAIGAFASAQLTTLTPSQTPDFAYGSAWKYLDNGSNQGTAWTAVTFNDASWASGNGQLGYGDYDETTVVSYGSNSYNKYVTTYFRKTFYVANPSAYSSITANVRRDDGIVVYVNGAEVYRNNMGTGAVSYTTLASLASDDGDTPLSFTISPGAFIAGNNVIAVEIHQTDVESSDITFDMQLVSTPVSGTCGTVTGLSATAITTTGATLSWAALGGAGAYDVDYKLHSSATWVNALSSTTATSADISGLTANTLYDWRVRAICTGAIGAYASTQFTTFAGNPVPDFTYGASWKYLDNGSNQGTAWTSPGFNDASWGTGEGELGYGDYDETTELSYGYYSDDKYVTTYFRKTINISDPAAFSSFTAAVKRDDGIVVYVNGTEVFRNNMGSGAVTYTTLASLASDDGETPLSFSIPPAAFTSGNNVIAVEIHQTKVSSTDITFDMELTSTPVSGGCGTVNGLSAPAITSSGATLSWAVLGGADNYDVEYKTNAASAWTTAAAATTATSVNLDGLAAGTLYDWRVRAHCAAGTGAYTSTQFTTTALATCGAVGGLGSSSITASTATLSWSALSGALHYDVEYKVNTAGAWTTAATATTATLVSLSGLSAGTLYDWRVRANCTGATGAYSSAQFTTADPLGCGAVAGLTTTAITTAAATLGWSALSGALNYDVDYKINASAAWTTAAAAVTETAVSLSGLTAGTLYDWRVRANCAPGSGAYSSTQFTTATPPSCGTVTRLFAASVTSSGATVSWSALSGASTYDVDFKASTSSTWINAASATTGISVNLSGLSAGTLYDWRVRANCPGATGAYGQAQFSTSTGVTATLTRGPYLNKALQNGIVLRWRTNIATNSKVDYGTAPGSLTQSVTDNALVTEHAVTLTGLSANTLYYYNIGSTTQVLQGDANNYFKTMPPVGSTQKIRVLAMGDMGNNSTTQVNVRNAWLNYNGTNYTDAWLLLGDNAYNSGTDAEYQSNFFNIYQGNMTRNHVLWPAVGNHDYANSSSRQADHAIPYYDMFALPANAEAGGVASNTEAFYSYNYGNVHFVSLDSYGWESGSTRLYDTLGPQATWLKQDLAANTQPWTIVYFHHPPYTKGSHDSDTESELYNMRQRIVPILERYNVDLVLNGHSHSYERSFLLNGHYGVETSFNAANHALSTSSAKYDGTANSCTYIKNASDVRKGIVYAVVGSAGQLGGSSSGYPHNAMYYSNVTNGGALYFEIENNRLTAKWIGADGVIRDNFNIMKEVNKTTNITIVSGNSATLTASWIGTYNWSNGATTNTITVNPTTSATYTVTDAMGCITDVFNVTVTQSFQGDDYQNQALRSAAGLYPNPVSAVLTVKFSGLNTAAHIRVMDINGRVVLSETSSQPDTSLDVSGLTNGVYVIVVTEGNGKPLFRSKFIKE